MLAVAIKKSIEEFRYDERTVSGFIASSIILVCCGYRHRVMDICMLDDDDDMEDPS